MGIAADSSSPSPTNLDSRPDDVQCCARKTLPKAGKQPNNSTSRDLNREAAANPRRRRHAGAAGTKAPAPADTSRQQQQRNQTPRGGRAEDAGDHLRRTTARRGGYALSGPRWEQKQRPASVLLPSLPQRRSPRPPFIHRPAPARGRTPRRLLLLERRCRCGGGASGSTPP